MESWIIKMHPVGHVDKLAWLPERYAEYESDFVVKNDSAEYLET